MKTAKNNQELEALLKNGETNILCQGELAKSLRQKRKRRIALIATGAATAIASAVAIPFTLGGSSAGIVAGSGFVAGGLGLTIGTITITAGELAILLGIPAGTLVTIYGIHKNKKIRMAYRKDGGVEMIVE